MTKCQIVNYYVAGPYAGQASTVAACETHGWQFNVGTMLTLQSAVCPIGQIENATEEGLARIAAALGPK